VKNLRIIEKYKYTKMHSNNTTNTWVIGCNRIHLPMCQSTNDEAALLARNDAMEGTVVSTDEQEAGRGQRGSSWDGGVGKNIMATVVLRPIFLSVREQFKISIAMALGVLHCVKELLPQADVEIKWPNDILANGKKIAGILIENTLKHSQLGVSLVGIGLNVNFFPEYLGTGTSLAEECGLEQNRDVVFDTLLKFLDVQYLRLRSGQTALQLEDYYASLAGFEQGREYVETETDRKIFGIIKGIEETGRLKLLVDGEIRFFDIKELRVVMNA
jgi:BirA family biotin operon repressor/biotin-[acetyl-CoA-carboxylase] ligase